MSVSSVQSGAIAKADSIGNQIDSLASSLANAAMGLGFSTINFPNITVPAMTGGSLSALSSAAGQVGGVPAPTMSPYPALPSAPSAPGGGSTPTYNPPSAPSGGGNIQTPGGPSTMGTSLPVAPYIEPFNPHELTALGTVPTFDKEVISIPDAPDYVTLPEFDVAPLALEELPSSSYLLDRTFDWSEVDYQSDLLDELKIHLMSNLYGGYGINPDDEQRLWERARERELLAATTTIEKVSTEMAARGWVVPPGAMLALVESANQSAQEKISSANRDIALKRADLYVENHKFTVQQAKDFEQMMITYWGYKQERALKAAQATIELAISTYNALATVYNARVQAYKTQLEAYKMRIEAALAPYERDKIMMEFAKVRAGLYQTKGEIYKTELQGFLSQIEINKAIIEQDKLKYEAQKLKLEKYIAEVQGFKAVMDGNASAVQANVAQWEGYKAQIQAKVMENEVYKTQLEAAQKVFQGQIQSYMLEKEVYKTELQTFASNLSAIAEQYKAIGAENASKMDAYKYQVSAMAEVVKGYAAAVAGEVEQYKATHSLAMQAAQINSQNSIAYGNFMNSKSGMQIQAYSAALSGLGNAMAGFGSAASGIAAEITNL